jgi:phospholipase C
MANGDQLGSVNHIVVLMLENRSFDHMLGFLYSGSGNVSPLTKQPFDGLTGEESNPGPDGAAVSVNALAAGTPNLYFAPGADPGEGYLATNMQLFGATTPSASAPDTNGGFVTDFANTLAGTDARRPVVPGTVASDIMGIFTPALLPVLSGLARGYAVCDHWFASAPTETFPNRAFASAATSQGHMDALGSSVAHGSRCGCPRPRRGAHAHARASAHRRPADRRDRPSVGRSQPCGWYAFAHPAGASPTCIPTARGRS